MKKLIGSILAITLFGFSVNAQNQDQQQNGNQSAYHKGHGKMDQNFEDLNLSETQKQQIKAINEDFKNKMKALKNNNSGADMSSQRQALMQERKAKISAVLTAEQKAKFEQRGDRGFGDRDDRGGKFAELNLSADQKARIKASNESFKTRIESIRNNQSLTEQQKREQLQALQTERQTAIRSILTAEQAAKFDQMHPQGGDFKGKIKGADGKQKIKAGKGKNKNKIKST